MRNRILLLGAIAFVAYVVGSRSVTVKKSESVPHQLVRMRDERKTKKARERKAKKIAAAVKDVARDVRQRLN